MEEMKKEMLLQRGSTGILQKKIITRFFHFIIS